MMSNFLLYLVTHRENLTPNRFHNKIVEAIEGGVTMVQLREKCISEEEYIKRGIEIKEILDKYEIPLIINDNPYVARKVGARGVHLGQSDCSVEEARNILGKDAIIGLSIENISQVEEANKARVNYIGVGPVFPTSTKKDAVIPLGIEAVKIIRSIVSKPLLAIGGINKHNVSKVIETGIDGICVSSAILAPEDTKRAAQELKTIITNEIYHGAVR